MITSWSALDIKPTHIKLRWPPACPVIIVASPVFPVPSRPVIPTSEPVHNIATTPEPDHNMAAIPKPSVNMAATPEPPVVTDAMLESPPVMDATSVFPVVMNIVLEAFSVGPRHFRII